MNGIVYFTLDKNNSIANIKTVYRLLEGMYFCLRNMTTERDLKNQFEYARKVAIAEGMAEGRAEGMALAHVVVAKNMLAMGLDVDTISKATGLSVDQINSL